MISNERHELLIYFEEFYSSYPSYHQYSTFLIGNETEKYMLKSLGELNGDRVYSNSILENLNMKFTTYDQDNDDVWWINCAKQCIGAWWFKTCVDKVTHLNGPYYDEKTTHRFRGIFLNTTTSLKFVQMMIRPKLD